MDHEKSSDAITRRRFLARLGMTNGAVALHETLAALGLPSAVLSQTGALKIPEGIGGGRSLTPRPGDVLQEDAVRSRHVDFKSLLASKFWQRFYQPDDFLWPPTLFQPVGGMDKIVQALAQEIAALGGDIKLGAVVTGITRQGGKFHVSYKRGNEKQVFEADYCISNMPIPLHVIGTFRKSSRSATGSRLWLVVTMRLRGQLPRLAGSR